MNFVDRLHAAGFKTKAEFARYIGRTPHAVTGWGEDIPLIAERVLQVRIDVLKALEK